MDFNGPGSTVFSDKGDIGKLIEELKSIEDSLGSIKEDEKDPKKGSSVRPKKDPKEDDLVKVAPLNFLVPTGFLLLHSDLQDILKTLKKGSGVSSGAAGAVTAVSTTISAATDLISVLKSPAGLGDILGNKEINDLLAHDPSVYDIRLAGTKGYLKSYYTQLIRVLGFDFDFDSGTLVSDTSLASGLNDIVSAFAGGLGKAVESVGTAIQNLQESSELNDDEEVKKIRKTGFMVYLQAYYANLLKPLGYNMDFTTGEISKEGSLSSGIADVFAGVGAGLGQAVEAVGNSINNLIENGKLDSDPDVQAVRKAGFIAYLKGYYNDLLQQFGLSVDYNTGEVTQQVSGVSFLSDLGQGLGNLFGGVIEGTARGLKNVVTDVVLETDPDVQAVRKKGFIAYLKGYYNDLLQQFGLSVDYNTGEVKKEKSGVSFLSDLGQGLGNLFGGVVEGTARGLENGVASAVTETDPDVVKVRKMGTIAYLKAYYENLLGEYGYSLDFSNGDIKEKDKGFWEKLKSGASNIGKSIGNLFSSASDSFLLSIGNLMDSSTLKDDTLVRETASTGVSAFLKVYLEKVKSDFIENKSTLFDNKKFKEIGSSLFSNIEDILESKYLIGDNSIVSARAKGIESLLESYLNNVKSDISKYKGDTLNEKEMGHLGKSLFSSLESLLGYKTMEKDLSVISARNMGMKSLLDTYFTILNEELDINRGLIFNEKNAGTLGNSFLNTYFTLLEEGLNSHKEDLFGSESAKDIGDSFTKVFKNYLSKVSEVVTVDINKGIGDALTSSTVDIVSGISKVNEFLSNINSKLLMLNTINSSINERVNEVKEVMPSYIPVAAPSDQGFSTIGEGDLVSAGR